MSITDMLPYVSLGGFALSLYVAIQGVNLRKQAKNDERWKLVEALEQRVTIAELRLKPLFTVMDQRLSAMFHEPHARYWRSDQLLERYWADEDEFRRSLSLAEIDELIGYVYEWYTQTEKNGPMEDAEKHFRAMQLLALLDGLKNVRKYLDETAAGASDRQEENTQSWWSKLKIWWRN